MPPDIALRRAPNGVALAAFALFGCFACASTTAATPPTTVKNAVAPSAMDPNAVAPSAAPGLWQVYEDRLKRAKHIDLTHTISPEIPVWSGFGPARFGRTVDPASGKPYTYASDGFEGNQYHFPTDQYGTQLDPPAHFAPEYPAIDELPPTYAVRPLVVISMVEAVKRDPAYHLQVTDIERWEAEHGRVPSGSVVMVRSDWSKEWPNPELAERTAFPGVSLEALRFLHEQRGILFHGHETLDTDNTPTMAAETWLMQNGFAQAEGVTNLDQVAPTGCLVAFGFPKLKGGLGGYARFIALCPADWQHGVAVGEVPEAPLPKSDKPLLFDEASGTRLRR